MNTPTGVFSLAKMSMYNDFVVGNKTKENQTSNGEVVCCESLIK